MKQVLIKQGQAVIEEIPAPILEPGTVLVRVQNSCISIGTELSGVKSSEQSLWKRAVSNPQAVKNTLQMAVSQGFGRTRSLVQGKLTAGRPTGYSAAGIVLETGDGVDEFRPGDRVACAGAQCAYHAEIIRVPRNLVVPIPRELDFPEASTVTLGAIALQGVRRTQPTLGESFVVIGLGILGQLTVQLLKANGCRVIGTDLDRSRIQQALEMGMDAGILPEETRPIEAVERFSEGAGADGVIITAATPSDSVVGEAFNMCRKKGRVVLVGDVGLNLNRGDLYPKELDFLISTSYGPGRYDKNYEEKGIDYPLGYVRWTENRNMKEYLRLLAEGKVAVLPLISETYRLEESGQAYEVLKKDSDRPLLVLLSYPVESLGQTPERVIPNPEAVSGGTGQIRIAVIGAGGFARAMHLPNLQALPGLFKIQAIMSRTGHTASAVAKQFRADYAATDSSHVLNDPDVDAVLIATRHNLHASMTVEALKAGKHVLVEKPLALTAEELDEIVSIFSSPSAHPLPVLLTGFNRRFSPYAERIQELVRNRTHPMILNYRMNAGALPPDHWVLSPEGGGRNRGEACHIYDLFTFLTGAAVVTVDARSISPGAGSCRRDDNFAATITFEDGSLATLTYTALGNQEHPKELLEVFVDGKVVTLEDYKRLRVSGVRGKDMQTKIVEKGHREELLAFAEIIRQGGDWPIPLWQQVQAMKISFEVEKQLAG